MDFIALIAGLILVSGYAGIALYAYRHRIYLAFGILRGSLELRNGTFSCAKTHLEPGHVAARKDELECLLAAANELKFCRGFVAALDNDRKYPDAANALLTNLKKVSG